MQNKLLDALNDEQKKAVIHKDGPLLIIAGAGTGKTTVIARRIAWLIQDQKVPSDHILGLTFTEKAAEEMEERIDQLLPFGYVDLWVSTFHAFCQRILQAHALEIGLPNDFTVLDETNQALLVREHFDEFKLSYYKPVGNPTKYIYALLKHISRAKDEGVSPEEYLAYAEEVRMNEDQPEFRKGEGAGEGIRISEIADAYHTYQRLLVESSAMDFGDLLLYTLKLFRKRPKILEHYRTQFRHLLVDEFQDTNHAQYELVKLLTNDDRNVTVVGDDDQSIYKFRGAAISNILEFQKDFSNAMQIVLTKNYRSRQNILDLSYGFIQQNNPNRLEVKLSGKGANISKRLQSYTKEPGIIKHLHLQSQEQEARKVLETIVELKKKDKKLSWSDFAILVRANDHASPYITVCERNNIPYRFLAARGLYLQPVVLDIMNYLQLLHHHFNDQAAYRVLEFAHWDIPPHDIMLLLDESHKTNTPLFKVLEECRRVKQITPSTVPVLEKIASFVTQHTQKAKTETIGQLTLRVLKETGYLKYLTEQKELSSTQKVLYLTQIFKQIESFEHMNPHARLKDFLDQISLAQEMGDTGSLADSWDVGPDTVNIMTIHGAKGLEFRYVFVVSLVDRRFPTTERKEQIPLPNQLVKEVLPEGDWHLEEERRLFYVAMTRARDGLFLTSAEDYGGTRKKKPSRFLVELGMIPKLEKGVTHPFDETPEQATYSDEEKLIRSRIPKQFSFTQFQAFETCPKQYKYAHILQIPAGKRFTFSFGKSMHAAVARFFEEVKEKGVRPQDNLFEKNKQQSSLVEMPKGRLQALLRDFWINEWYDSASHEERYKERGDEEMKLFEAAHLKGYPIPFAIEQPFTLKVGEYWVKGVIDRIDMDEKGAHIVDYKTGTAPKPDEKIAVEDVWQLYLYALAVQQVLKKKVATLGFYYFETGTYYRRPWDASEEQSILTKTSSSIEKILQSNFIPTPTEWKCSHCDFRDICEDRVG